VSTVVLALLSTLALGGCSSEDGGSEGGGAAAAGTGQGASGSAGNPGTAGTAGGGSIVETEPAELAGTLAAHNDARAAEGLTPLTWDPALAAIATAWGSQCIDSDGNGLVDHNDGRSDTYPTYVGENIYGSSGNATGTAAVQSWMEEASGYDAASCTCTGGTCGHYTQVMWADTTKVGCALVDCPSLRFGSAVICDYAPGGNIGGQCPF